MNQNSHMLYLTSWDFTGEASDGVCKKINAQIKAFRKAGYAIDLTCIKNERTAVKFDNGVEKDLGDNFHFSKFWAHKRIAEWLWEEREKWKYDVVYVRYNKADPWLLKALTILKKSRASIVVEMPMFPYEEECKVDTRSKMVLVVDHLFRKQLKYSVDRIVTFLKEAEIFDIPTITIINGIDFESVRPRNAQVKNIESTIHLLAVALFAPAHGYDRLLKGLGGYYANGGTRNIVFDMVGDGRSVAEYRKLIDVYDLQDHVTLHGKKYGEELDEFYDRADIGVSALGQFRQVAGNHISSTLKSREYCAKGLPIITGCELDVMPSESCDFVLVCGNEDTPIDIENIIAFYDKLYQKESREDLIQRIRSYGENNCSIEKSVEPIVRYFQQINKLNGKT